MQSMVAVADSYQFHHEEQQHESHEYIHGSQLLSEHDVDQSNSTLLSNAQADCHHCCSSHVMAHFSLAVNLVNTPHFDHLIPAHDDGYRSHLHLPAYRPPIATKLS